MAKAGNHGRLIPRDRVLLSKLYWDDNMTVIEIADLFGVKHPSVRKIFNQLHIPRRKVGMSRYSLCRISGCNKPIFKVFNRTNNSWYGLRCEEHWKEHRWELAARYALRETLLTIPNEEERRCLIQAKKQMMRILSHQQGFSRRIVSPLASEALERLKSLPSS